MVYSHTASRVRTRLAVCEHTASRVYRHFEYVWRNVSFAWSRGHVKKHDISVQRACLNLRCVFHHATKSTTPLKTTVCRSITDWSLRSAIARTVYRPNSLCVTWVTCLSFAIVFSSLAYLAFIAAQVSDMDHKHVVIALSSIHCDVVGLEINKHPKTNF